MPFIPFGGAGSDELLYRQMVADFISRESASIAMRKTESIGDLFFDVFRMPETAGLKTIDELKNNYDAMQTIAQNEHAVEMLFLNEEHAVGLLGSATARAALLGSPYGVPAIAGSFGAMNALANLPDAVADVASNTLSLSQLLSSPYVVDTLWTKSSSGKIWDVGNPAPPATVTGLGVTSKVAGRQGNGVAMKAEFTVSGSTGTVGTELTLNLTGINTLSLYETNSSASSCEVRVVINGSTVFSRKSSRSVWGDETINVIDYTGDCVVGFFIYRSGGSAGIGFNCSFCDIQLA